MPRDVGEKICYTAFVNFDVTRGDDGRPHVSNVQFNWGNLEEHPGRGYSDFADAIEYVDEKDYWTAIKSIAFGILDDLAIECGWAEDRAEWVNPTLDPLHQRDALSEEEA